MASRLSPCPSCSRHVKVGPPSCPFCGGAVPTDVPARIVPAGRPLSRAALLFAGVAGASTVAACSSSSSTPVVVHDAGLDGQVIAAYGVIVPDGGFPEDDATTDDASGDDATGDDADEPDGGPVAAYGVVVLDAGDDASSDADEPDGAPVAAYGVATLPDAGDAGE